MRLKSLLSAMTNKRIQRTCVGNIFMLCLLSSKVWSLANVKHNRFVRQLNAAGTPVNYEEFAITNPYHQPHFTGNRSVVVQLFEWKFVDIAAECREFLGPQGYAGVQISPALEHTVIQTEDFNHPWWERYEVVSYRLASRSGDESEFWAMTRICNEHGVRIYADVVLNHMAAPLHFIGVTEANNAEDFIVNTVLETNVNLTQLNYSNVSYTRLDFHRPYCMVLANTQDAHEIRNCQLNGHPDLDHSRDNVQQHVVEMLNKFVDMGVAGFRIDAAKYMWPIDLKNILKQVKDLSPQFNFKKNARPFVYLDVFDLGLDAVSKTEYSTYGVVSEYLYPTELSTILQGKVPLSSLINWGPALGFLPHEDSLVFIDSHDTQRGVPWELGHNQMLTYKNRVKYLMANIFMLVHPYGALKRIMSSYYFPDANINQGPPVEEGDDEEIRSPKFNEQRQCTKESGWVCEHRWPQLVNMIKVANYFQAPGNKEESVIYFQTNGPNQVAFCRGQKAFVAINNDAEMDFVKEVYACLEPGVYCDVVTGGKKEGEEECHGKSVEINETGYMNLQLNAADDKRGREEEGIAMEDEEKEEESGKIESLGIMVIYVESKIQAGNRNEEELIADEGNQIEAEEPKSNEDNEVDNNKTKDTEEEIDKEGNDAEHEEAKDEEAGSNESPEEKIEEADNIEEKSTSASERGEGDESYDLNESREKIEIEGSEESEGEKQIEGIDSGEENSKDEDEDANNNEDNKTESLENSQNEGEEPATENSSKEEDVVTGNPAEDQAEEPKTNSNNGNNQSRNLDERNTKAEEQLEKPSVETVDEVTQISDTVTAKIQDLQSAGIFKGDRKNG